MLYIIVEKNTSRLNYVLEVFFSTVVSIPYQVINLNTFYILWEQPDIRAAAQEYSTLFFLNYSSFYLSNIFWMPPSGLLTEQEVYEHSYTIGHFENQVFYLEWENTNTGSLLPEVRPYWLPDFFAAAFYILTEYEFMLAQQGLGQRQLDIHKRLFYPANILFQSQYYKTPVVESYVHYLLQKLQVPSSLIQYPKQQPWLVTVDIDSPWRYLYKGWCKNGGALLRDSILFKFEAIRRRVGALITKKDPYATLELFQEAFGRENIIFFWLVGGVTKYDTSYVLSRHKQYAKYIQNYQEQDVMCALHPSYAAAFDFSILEQEKAALEKVIKKKVEYARFHFFRLHLPASRKALLRLGIFYDFTTALVYDNGFLHGMARPFPWFDLEANTQTELILFPTHVMDRTFISYQKLTPQQALLQTWQVYEQVRIYKGCFTLLLHPPVASGVEEWQDWKFYFNEIKTILTR
ncbi:MAG: hypothetical protein RML72_05215 [Bacteroidia bacterium]|nr:hypothetical protein [Bacteroidia bacterium]MDW8158264.1 hypothetical protein [Bacteroidia bacterium]